MIFYLGPFFLEHNQGVKQGLRVAEVGPFLWCAQELCCFTIRSKDTADSQCFEGGKTPQLLISCTRLTDYMERSP
jgi:hypothetical protein